MVEIIPKKPEMEFPLKNVFLFIVGALLVVAVLSYAVLVRTNIEALNTLQDFEDGINKVGTKEDKEIETKVFDAEKRVGDFSILFAGRSKSSLFFGNFASLVHPQVWFSSIDLDPVQMRASVSGQAPNFKIIDQQLSFLQKQDQLVDSLDLSNIAMGEEGRAEFSINFIFKPPIFNATSVDALIKK